jgi:predicted ATPase/class 3 adenylate cyclase
MQATGAAPRTLTLLFTDIEGSTRALKAVGDERYAELLDVHLSLLSEHFRAAGGHDAQSEGDALFYVFESAGAAVEGAIAAQRSLTAHPWPEEAPLFARIGLHTGEVLRVGARFRGLAVHQAARICAAGHGGQILLSRTTSELVEGRLPSGTVLRDLGMYRLKDLAEPTRVFQICASGLRAEFPPPKTLDVFAHNLPLPPSPFIGRTDELAETIRLVRSGRLVTLTGPGGMGKTRMAIEVATVLAGDFEDGVWFVDLTPLRDASHVVNAISTALGVPEDPERTQAQVLLEHLRGLRLLLVLDNFEQVSDAADLVSDIVSQTNGVHVLVTSRVPLRLRGEHEYPLPPMAAASSADPRAVASADASALFLQQALSVNPGFELTDESARAINALVVRLEGLPLAIELAASRSKVLAPTDLIDRIETSIDVLSSDRRDAPERQRTIRDTLRWSYDLLGPDERRALLRLAVFRGTCSVEAAESVCGPGSLSAISSLVDHSLVRRTVLADGTTRIGLLGLVREFAAEQLSASGDRDGAEHAHLAWHRAWAERAAEALRGPDQARWLAALDRDIDDLRAALDHVRRDPSRAADGLMLIADLGRFWRIRGYVGEVLPVLEELLTVPVDAPAARARALLTIAEFHAPDHLRGHTTRKDAQRIHPYLDEALRLARACGDDQLTARALTRELTARKRLKGVKSKHLRPEIAAATELATRLGDEELLLDLRSASPLGFIASVRAGFQTAGGTFLMSERLDAARKTGDRAALAEVLLARVSALPSKDEDRWQMGLQALDLARQLGDRRAEADALHAVGANATIRRDYEIARDRLLESYALSVELGHEKRIAAAALALRQLARAVGDRSGADRFGAEHRRADPGQHRTFAVMETIFGDEGIGVLPFAAALAWIVVPSAATGTFAAVALCLATWVMSSDIREHLYRYALGDRTVGGFRGFPFTVLTLVAFGAGVLMRLPSLGPLVVTAVALLRFWTLAARSGPSLRAVGAASGATAGVASVADLALSSPEMRLLACAAFGVFVAIFGWCVRPGGPPSLRVGQVGWFLFRFGWPVVAVAAFAASRSVDIQPWDEWAAVVAPLGLACVAVMVALKGRSERLVALPLAACATLFALTLLGRAELTIVAGVLLGASFIALALFARFFPSPPILVIDATGPADAEPGTDAGAT